MKSSREIKQQPIEVEYERIVFEESGGVLELPKLENYGQNKQEYKENVAIYQLLAKHGEQYRILPVRHPPKDVIPQKGEYSSPDALNLRTGQYSDAKSPHSQNAKSAIQRGYKDASKKGCGEVVFKLLPEYSEASIWNANKSALGRGRNRSIKKVILIDPDERVKIYDADQIRKLLK
ncbi:MAG: hypothetical protein LBB27_03875 [Tannerellaceae bacterium]|jgi:hypothetical protein|nr:hypothetical protein [Tannerellaceae bacterium]